MNFVDTVKRSVLMILATLILSACGESAAPEPPVTTNEVPKMAATTAPSSASDTLTIAPPQTLAQVVFADARLASCVEKAAKARGWQRVDDITVLSCADKKIASIGGIQNLHALTSLDLKLNEIDELAPLAKLGKLKSLDLSDNLLVDIAPLKELSALSELYLGTTGQLSVVGNSIRDISVLSHLQNLKQLDLSHNQISDLTPLSGLRSLQLVHLGGNQIRDISALMDLAASAKVNLFDNNNIACAQLSRLETLLPEGQLKQPVDCLFTLDILITDIAFVDSKLKSCVLDTASAEGWITIGEMGQLVCDEQNISDLSGLEQLKALNHLDLTRNPFIDISALFELTNTNSILLSDNSNIACSRLEALEAELGSGVISRPANCAPVTLLVDLDIIDPTLEQCVQYTAKRHNWHQISEMTQLSCPPTQNQAIEELSGIEQLKALKTIELTHFNCADLDALSDITGLELARPQRCL